MRRILFAVLVLSGILAAAPVRAERFGPIRIEPVPQAIRGNDAKGGYFVCGFRVENRGVRPAEIRMSLRNSGDGIPRSAERRLLIAPGSERNVSLCWPPLYGARTYLGSQPEIELTIDGERYENELMKSIGSSGLYFYGQRGILVSDTVPVADFQSCWEKSTMRKWVRNWIPATIPVAQWGTHLRDYSSVDFILIGSGDPVPPEVARALDEWVYDGGTLGVCVPPDAPWPEGLKEPAGGKILVRDYGWGRRVFLRPIPSGWKKAKAVELTPGLEYLFRISEGKVFRPFAGADDPTPFHKELNLSIPPVPLQWLFFVMLVFVIVIGLVNYFVLHKFRKEPLILLTTPVVSILFCLLVIGFISFQEGWSSRVRAFGMTLLDQTTGQAATRAIVSVYSPLTPRGGFRFDPEDVLRFSGVGALDLREGDSQFFGSGLLQPRIPLSYSVDRVSRRLEHLKLTREKNGEITAVNGLGVRLSSLSVVAPDCWLWVSGGAVEPGAKASLRRVRRVPEVPLAREQLWNTFFKQKKKESCPVGLIAPGYYVAFTGEPVFWTPGFKPDEFKLRQVVIGKYHLEGDSGNGN